MKNEANKTWHFVSMVDLRNWLAIYLELSPPKLLDQSKNVTVSTFHIWPRIVHDHIFLALGGARSPQRYVARKTVRPSD